MSDVVQLDSTKANALLDALGEHLAVTGERFELVVVGGSALIALGLVERVTRDVDVVALRATAGLIAAKPLPTALASARDRVARDFQLPSDWLNTGPASLLDFGLPPGFEQRLVSRHFGPALTVHFAGRLDLIHLKLFAVVDQGSGRHEADLRALKPRRDELLDAARWTRTHDPSPGFRSELLAVLAYLGVVDADVGD